MKRRRGLCPVTVIDAGTVAALRRSARRYVMKYVSVAKHVRIYQMRAGTFEKRVCRDGCFAGNLETCIGVEIKIR